VSETSVAPIAAKAAITMAAAIKPSKIRLQPGPAPSTVYSSMSAAFLLPGQATVARRMRAGAAAIKWRPSRSLALFQSAEPADRLHIDRGWRKN
jgi:hypothetical protein